MYGQIEVPVVTHLMPAPLSLRVKGMPVSHDMHVVRM